VTDPVFRLVTPASALEAAPAGWARELLQQGEMALALDAGERSRAELLVTVWEDVPTELLPMAAMAMEAHLEKLEVEERLPFDLVE